jgi:TonB-dependent starch-binding outer membrane protein SusC
MKRPTAVLGSGKQMLLFAAFLFFLLPGAFAQNTGTVTGTVMSPDGDMLTGVTVVATNSSDKSESHNATTNEKGVFVFRNLRMGSMYNFLVSYVGYETETVNRFSIRDANNSILIRMTQTDKSLGEVVVIGYGTQRRETVTGSIATIKAEDFNAGQINDPMTLIAGKVAGLSISNTNRSDPNATADFSLRGPATVEGNSQPLIVIDGVPGGDLQTIAPNDIASIDVLKDGSAAAIYGSRATAGVIIVTTKRGRAGRTRVNYSGYMTVDKIARKYDVFNAAEYRKFGQDNSFAVDDAGADTDWFDEVTRTPFSHSHNLSLSGGNERTTYYASLNYRNNQGIDLKSQRRFINGTFRLNTKALDDKLDFSLMVVNAFENRDFANYGAIAQSLNMNPTYPVKNPDGTYYQRFDVPFGLQWNPVASTEHNINNNKEKKFLSTVNLRYHVLPEVTAGISYSLIKNDFLSGAYTSREDFFQQRDGVGGQASRSETNVTNNVLEATLAYDRNYGDHTVNAIAGYSYQNIFNEGLSAGNNNFITDAFRYYNLGAGTALNNFTPNFNRTGVFVGSFANERTLVAYFGRIIYDFQQKYLLNLSVRREGASVLGKDNKWGTFYGISAGWVLSKEGFLTNAGFLNNLKLRAGYGVTGNQESLNPYQSLATIGPFYGGTQNGYFGEGDNGTWILPYGPNLNANPLLQWETKSEINIGVDFSLFRDGWLNGSIDYYNRRIKNLVGNYSAQLPAQIFPTIFANAGLMENEGVELMLNAKLINSNNFSWLATFTGAHNRNEIISVTSDQFYGTAHNITRVSEGTSIQRLAPGQPVAVFYGRVFAGFTEDGLWLFQDSEGKPVPASEIGEDDFAYLGNSIPRYSLGLTNTFTLGKFDASILIRSALGFHAVNGKRMFHENWTFFTRNNLFNSALGQKITDAPTFSSYYIEKGDYMKIDNVTIGYTVPVKKSNYLESVRVYFTGTNLATITGFSGADPELQLNYYPSDPNAEVTDGPGLESNYGYFPSTRSFTLGVNVNF